jgi:serine/threonine-protein phosphatase 2A regulatory subunit A
VDLVREELIGQYISLLKDNEAEVRTAGAGQIPGNIVLPYHPYLTV